MAANAVTQGSDPAVVEEWLNYALADGQHHDTLAAEVGASDESDSRMSIAGFRMLGYDGDTARVDVAIATTNGFQAVYISGVYELVWQDGDWKISSDVTEPLEVAAIPNIIDYVPWGEGL